MMTQQNENRFEQTGSERMNWQIPKLQRIDAGSAEIGGTPQEREGPFAMQPS